MSSHSSWQAPRLQFAFAAIAAVLSTPGIAQIVPFSPSQVYSEAKLVVTATARASKARHERNGQTIRTYVTFDSLSVHKGASKQSKLVLRFEGGRVGDDMLEVHGMPEFTVGRRYLLFVRGNGRALSPIVGFNQGAFEVVMKGTEQVLKNLAGHELVGIERDRFVFARKTEQPVASRAKLPERRRAAGRGTEHVVKPAHPDAERLEQAMRARERGGDKNYHLDRLPNVKTGPSTSMAEATPVTPGSASLGLPVDRRAAPLFVTELESRGPRLSVHSLLTTAKQATRNGDNSKNAKRRNNR